MPLNKLRKLDGIFGTPTEPLFNNEENGCSAELLQDWLVNMALVNSQNVRSKQISQNIFNHGSWAQYVFLMCDRFELPQQARFAALQIFDRFMMKHIYDLYEYVQNSESTKKSTDWAGILERVKNQVFLRILSCCQIASKLNSHYKVITIKHARKCLLEAGYSYNNESIVQSEMRVLKALSYKVSMVTSLDFIEILLEILGYNAGAGVLDVKVYHDTAIKILTLVYLHRHEIYNRLYLNTSGFCAGVLASSQEQRNQLATVTFDKMLLSVAVVATAVHINNDSLTHQVIMQLHKISEVPVEDIKDFCKVLLLALHDYTSQTYEAQFQDKTSGIFGKS